MGSFSSLRSGAALGLALVLVTACSTTDSTGPTDDAGTTTDDGSTPPVPPPSAGDAAVDAPPPPPACGRNAAKKCADGEACDGAPDCVSGVCRTNVCQPAKPADGVQNGDETDVDCGGSAAPACVDGLHCLVKDDCQSGVCTGGVCQVPTDTDGVKNGDETGVDCGGPTTPKKCPTGQGCKATSDCTDGKCDVGATDTCLAPSHTDGLKNDGETGVDCGGSALPALKCPQGQGCASNADCNALKCDVGVTDLCLPPSHTDGVKNDGETGVDCGGAALPALCGQGDGCASNADCNALKCDVGVTNLCLPPSHGDGILNDGETGIDCGGAALPAKCPTGQGCASDADCNNVLCGTVVPKLCLPPANNDGLQNGTETDIDCGGGAPTNAPKCTDDKSCLVDTDCAHFCSVTSKKCVAGRSCKSSIAAATAGITTCGPTEVVANHESCCKTIAISPTVSIDKYNVTAGRFRQFVETLNGDLRTYITNNTPGWWDATWTAKLPTMKDNGQVTPDDAPAFTGVYQELGPYVHGTAGGGNEGCYISGFGARTYRVPDSVNAKWRNPPVNTLPGMNDPQLYSQDFLDTRPLNCVTAYMMAAFCAWDGGRLPTAEQLDVVWGGAKYPWGAQAPAGYDQAYGTDPAGGFGKEAYGPFNGAPFVAAPFPLTDTLWANYNYNYWGGGAVVGTDYSLLIAPPGRFPNGNSTSGHADLAGQVFDITESVGTTARWSRSGSWQGHTIPWTAAGTWSSFPASNKYWATGGRCAR